jgi:hypothetical protein
MARIACFGKINLRLSKAFPDVIETPVLPAERPSSRSLRERLFGDD